MKTTKAAKVIFDMTVFGYPVIRYYENLQYRSIRLSFPHSITLAADRLDDGSIYRNIYESDKN